MLEIVKFMKAYRNTTSDKNSRTTNKCTTRQCMYSF